MNSTIFRLISTFLLSLFAFEKANAQCSSEAGTMDLAPIQVCGLQDVTVIFLGDAVLDADDVFLFVIHTDPDNTLSNVIDTSSTPTLPADYITPGVTYYISSVVGNSNGQGGIDYTDPCLAVSAGSPVTWHELPTATMLTSNILACAGQSVELQGPVTFTGTAPWTLDFSINGVPQPPIVATASPFTVNFGSFDNSTAICLEGVSDAFCTNSTGPDCITVVASAPLECDVTVTDASCFGNADGSAAFTCTGGLPPYTFLWSNGQGGPFFQNLSPGTYSLTVVDAAGCVVENTFVISEQASLPCTLFVSNSINCTNPEAQIGLDCLPDMLPFTVAWTGPNGFNSILANPIITQPGTYTVLVTGAAACTYEETFTVTGGNLDCGTILGHLSKETDGNCTPDPGENPLANWMVRATATNGDEYFGITDSLGNYSFSAALGDYAVEAIPPAAFWDDCTGLVSLSLADTADVDTADFHQFQTINCPLMEVDISAPLLRRCFDNSYFVNYCNNGSQTATGAFIEVALDPLITLVSASQPYTGPVNGVYTFPIGDVLPGHCGGFHFIANVSCDAVLGQTLCAEAHAYPDSLCAPVDPNWSGAFVEASSDCTADSVTFTLTNTGTGDMGEPSFFIVVEDGVMLMSQEFELEAGGSTTVSYPASGSSFSLLAQQVDGAPGYSSPSIFVEGCGGGAFSTGFALQFPEDDADPFLSIDCQEVIGSYDPNDKRGYPVGFGPDHLIEVGQSLDYHIRFQNTGTDTAFTVVIHDVIAAPLDIATLRPGAASHPYQLDIHQDTLIFTFDDILLPDSNINEPGSHGFVKFSVGQRAGLPLGTVIENEAAIFFDFNEAVITNRTRHELGEPFFPSAVQPPVLRPKITCLVYPNPMGEEAVVVLQGADNQPIELRLYDLTGRHLRSETITGGMGKIRKNGLAGGLYFYEIVAEGLVVGQGKVAME